MSLDTLIAEGIEKQKAHRQAANAEKALKKELEDVKIRIQQACEEAGVNSASIKGFANVSVTTKDMPTVKDWDLVANYIKQNDALHLFQKRIHQSAFEEIVAMGNTIPGIETFEKTNVTIRDLS